MILAAIPRILMSRVVTATAAAILTPIAFASVPPEDQQLGPLSVTGSRQ